MIFRPVSPASPCGPPTTNRPVGFTSTFLSFTSKPASRTTGRTTWARMPARSCALSIMSECCADTTIVSTAIGLDPSYTTLTCVLPSGRSHGNSPLLRTVASPTLVHTERNVGGLPVDGRQDRAGLGIEAEVRVGVPDRGDRAAHDVRD